MSTRISHVDSTSPVQNTHLYDHISNLPYDVLSKILSLLPLKDGVRTCVLSKDWENKWTSIYDVKIDIHDFSLESRKRWNVVNIVERVLHRLKNVANLSLTFSCPVDSELNRLMALVPAMSRHNVEHLELDIHDTRDFYLHWSLLNFTKLRYVFLVFATPCSFRFRAENCYPNLKHLTLQIVRIVNDSPNTDTLIFTLPVLKELQLTECEWVNAKFVEIYAPSLVKLTSITPSEWDDKNDFDYSIKIFGNKLNELETGGGYPENISVIGSHVAFANLQYMCDHPLLSVEECGLQVRKLLRQLPYLEHLKVEQVHAIGKAKLGLSIQLFTNLKILHLGTPFDTEGMLELFYAAPFLKRVRFTDMFEDKTEHDHEYDTVKPIPPCVVHHLEEVEIFYYHVNENTMRNFRVEKFLMKNGSHLKTLIIRACDGDLEKEIFEKLSTFPKASAYLQIVCCDYR